MNDNIYENEGPAGAIKHELIYQTVNMLWFQRTVKSLKLKHREETFNALEIGAGAGSTIGLIKQHLPTASAVACDIYIPASLKGKDLFPEISFAVCDGCSLSYASGYFDTVIIHDVLEHVTRPAEMIKEAYRVLKRGGTLFLFVPCEGQPGTIHALFPANIKKLHGHIQDFRLNEVVTMVRQTRFSITAQIYSFHIIGQISDIIPYFIDRNRVGILSSIANKVIDLLARTAYVESRLLENYPGLCLEIMATK
jgi:ubiquinone/menaquinone biosynthesis C-methylase UbiE